MKISSASKKVLASALSAAMVVAFAPTVAFGAAGDAITVTVDLAGGTGAQTDYSWAKQGDTISLGSPTKDGYALDHWYLDANGNGTQDGSESNILTPTSVTLPSDSATATYRAVYATPTSAIAYGATETKDADNNYCVGKLTVSNTTTSCVEGKTYTVTVKAPDGTELLKKEYKPADASSKASIPATLTVEFAANPLSSDATQVDAAQFLMSGKYTVTLNDGTSDVDTESVELVKVTYKDGQTSTSKYYAQTQVGFTLEDGIWLDADGYAVSNGKGMSGDVTLTKATATATVDTAAYATVDRTISFNVADTEATNKASYAVVVKKDGAQVYSTQLSKATSEQLSATQVKFSFNAGYNGAIAQGGATESAGTYSIEVTKSVEGKSDQVTKAKLVLTEVKYDAGEHGAFKSSVTGTDVFASDAGSYTTSVGHNATNIDLADGYELDGATWQLAGKAFDARNLKAGEVNTLTAKYKAAAEKIATPVVTVTKALKKNSTTDYEYTFTATCATPGAKIQYHDGSSYKEGSTYKVDANNAPATVKFQAIYVANQTDPKYNDHNSVEVTFTKNAKGDTWKTATAGAASTGANFESKVGKTSVKWLAVDSVKAAIESGKASIDALGDYYSDAKAASAAELAAYKALYEAVDAYAAEFLGQYASNAPVVVDGKVYVVASTSLADTNKAVANAEKKVSDTKKPVVETYTTGISEVITAVNAASYTESKDYTAADVKAAADVTASLKAAKDATAAKAAIEAYNKLTDAQKALVATADVTAAQAIVTEQEKKDAEAKAAEQLKDAQDLAAARDLNGKRVVAKAKVGKKAKGKAFTYALAASESGATGTYAKVSGSKYIKVSAAGKVTFTKVKVAKKAKTFKATVSVTFGTQTVTKTVKYVVKKK